VQKNPIRCREHKQSSSATVPTPSAGCPATITPPLRSVPEPFRAQTPPSWLVQALHLGAQVPATAWAAIQASLVDLDRRTFRSKPGRTNISWFAGGHEIGSHWENAARSPRVYQRQVVRSTNRLPTASKWSPTTRRARETFHPAAWFDPATNAGSAPATAAVSHWRQGVPRQIGPAAVAHRPGARGPGASAGLQESTQLGRR